MPGGFERLLSGRFNDAQDEETSGFDWFTGKQEPGNSGFERLLGGGSPSYQPQQAAPELSMLEGALGSTISAIPELFGTDPLPGIQRWRDEHPVADIVSQLAGIAVPYAGMYRLSQVPKFAGWLEKGTEGTLKAMGVADKAAAPIRAGALKEFLRYTPLEMSRLGTGWALDTDMGDMFADVALSQALAGALGGVGGYLRAGGRVIDDSVRIAGAEQGLMPTFEYRIAKDPESTLIAREGFDRDQFLWEKKQEVLKQVPDNWYDRGLEGAKPKDAGKMSGRYIWNLENATPESEAFLERLFKPNGSNWGDEQVQGALFDIRQLHTDAKAWSVGEGVGDDVARRAGFADLDELAETVVYPRLVKVGGQPETKSIRETSGQLGGQIKKLLETGALYKVDGDTLVGVEDGGLFVFMKRVQKGVPDEGLVGPKGRRVAQQFGPMKVTQGDEWLIGKTDKIGKIAGETHTLNEQTMAAWAKYKDPFRQLAADHPIAREFNLTMRALSPEDWTATRYTRKKTWVAEKSKKLTEAIKKEGGLADQGQINALADKLYDIVAPTAFKKQGNSVFGRLYGLMEGGMKMVDEVATKITDGVLRSEGTMLGAVGGKNVRYDPFDGHTPVRELVYSLDEDELQVLKLVAEAQTPSKELKKLVDEGLVNPKTEQVIKQLQAINENMLNKYVLPALKEADAMGGFDPLKGYIYPRVFPGDSVIRITDEQGAVKWLAGGYNPPQAQAQAKRIIDEAAKEGKVWKAGPVESLAARGLKTEADDLTDVLRMVTEDLARSDDAQQVVMRATRQLLAEQASKSGIGGAPKRLQKKRTGLPGAPDLAKATHEDIITAITNHNRQMMRWAVAQNWHWRFGTQAFKWGQKNKTQYQDMMRKASQWLGREGQITTQLNNLLRPVLGNVLGGKPATRIAQEANELMYNWQLAILNPTFALLNLLQPLQTVAPWIAFMQRAPTDEAIRMMQMDLRFNSAGKVAGSVGVLSPLKVLKEATALLRNPPAELRQMFDQAIRDGTIAAHIHEQWVSTGARNASDLREAAAKGGWEFIKKTATLMATRSEQYSRLVSFNSAYLLGKNFFGLEGDKLYRFARKGVETTMYGYGVMDRSRVLTGPVGSMFGLFKNFQFHFIGQMAQYAGLAMRDGIWAPMLWQMGSALAIGGLGATPLVLMADGLSKWFSDSPNSFHWLQNNWQGPAGDAIYFGLPALIGGSLQASSVLPGVDVTQDIESLTNVVMWERAKQAWAGVAGAADLWTETGDNPLKNADVRDKLIAGFLPRAAIRAFSTTEGDYIRSMTTGSPTVRDLTPVQKVLHGAGFNVVEIEEHYIAGKFSYKKQQETRERINGLGQAFSEAQMANDVEAMDGIIRRAIASGVSVQSVISSARARTARELSGDHLSKYGAEAEAMWQVLDE